MTLYFRLIYLAIRYFLLKNINFGGGNFSQPANIHFRAWPLDCDFNLHINNGRYLSFMDIGRVCFLADKGLLEVILKKRWTPMLHAVDLTFIRPISPFKKFKLSTKLIGWDEKYFYMEQRFIENGQLRAVGLAKGLFFKGKKKVSNTEVMAYLGDNLPKQEIPELVKQWNHMKEIKKEVTQ